jgi:hypothetical protein
MKRWKAERNEMINNDTDTPTLGVSQSLLIIMAYTLRYGPAWETGHRGAVETLMDKVLWSTGDHQGHLHTLTSMHPQVRFEGGLAYWTVEKELGDHVFDERMGVLLLAMTAPGGRLRLNSDLAGKPEGKGRFYLRIEYGGGSNLSVDRIVADAQPGERVREAEDHHWHLPEKLRKVPVAGFPSKFNLGREDAIERALVRFDKSAERQEMGVSRRDYEAILRVLLAATDAAADQRRADADESLPDAAE